jgi:hypothetical protein
MLDEARASPENRITKWFGVATILSPQPGTSAFKSASTGHFC